MKEIKHLQKMNQKSLICFKEGLDIYSFRYRSLNRYPLVSLPETISSPTEKWILLEDDPFQKSGAQFRPMKSLANC